MVQPLPYHQRLFEYFQSRERELWEWYSSETSKQRSAESVRLELLKKTYRMEESEHERLYALGREAREAVGVQAPLTLYQSQDVGALNAFLASVPGEAHVVLSGPVTEKLSDRELVALLGHELSHYRLFADWDERYLVVDQLLAAVCNSSDAPDSYLATSRLFNLFNEVYCDRGALLACGDVNTVVSMLIKMETGIESTSPQGFLIQVDEVFDKTSPSTEGLTHPEAFIRARALQLWSTRDDNAGTENDVESLVARMLRGRLQVGELDLVSQVEMTQLTRHVIHDLLRPDWMRTETNLNHARLFFPEFEFDSQTPVSTSSDLIELGDSMSDYLCYLLLDFATVDRQLEDLPLAHAVRVAQQLGLSDRLAPIAQKELRLRKKQYAALVQDAGKILEGPPAPNATDRG